MAAKTPSTVRRESAGSQTKIVATFTDIDDTDTWASGLGTNVQDYYFVRKEDPATQANTGVAVAFSAGTFTFHAEEDNSTGDLVVFGNF
jgi:hypothetical protein